MRKNTIPNDKHPIKFTAAPFMILCFLIGLSLIVLKLTVIDSQDKMLYRVLGEILSVLAGTVISVVVLNFFITISTERELIDKIQTRIDESTDYASMKDQELCLINKKVTEAVLQRKNCDTSEIICADIQAMCTNLSSYYWNMICDATYYETYNRAVAITLEDSYVKIQTTARIVYINISEHPNMKFRLQSMFRTIDEAKSFEVTELTYNKEDYLNEYLLLQRMAKIYKAKNNNRYYTRTPWEKDISKLGRHEITYTTTYKTDYSLFFQTKTLDYNCKAFMLSASICDNRSKRNPSYCLRWEIMCSPLDKGKIISDRAVQDEDTRFSTLGGIQWFPKGGGYVLTLNPLFNSEPMQKSKKDGKKIAKRTQASR